MSVRPSGKVIILVLAGRLLIPVDSIDLSEAQSCGKPQADLISFVRTEFVAAREILRVALIKFRFTANSPFDGNSGWMEGCKPFDNGLYLSLTRRREHIFNFYVSNVACRISKVRRPHDKQLSWIR